LRVPKSITVVPSITCRLNLSQTAALSVQADVS
jgi:hypothetical protein